MRLGLRTDSTDSLYLDKLSTLTMAGRPDADLSFPTPSTDAQRGRRPGRVQLTLSPERSPPRAVQVSPDLDKPSEGLEDVKCKMTSLCRKEQRSDRSLNRSPNRSLNRSFSRSPKRSPNRSLKEKLELDTE